MSEEIRYPEEVRVDAIERRLQRVIRSIQVMEVRKFELQTKIKRAALIRPAEQVAAMIFEAMKESEGR